MYWESFPASSYYKALNLHWRLATPRIPLINRRIQSTTSKSKYNFVVAVTFSNTKMYEVENMMRAIMLKVCTVFSWIFSFLYCLIVTEPQPLIIGDQIVKHSAKILMKWWNSTLSPVSVKCCCSLSSSSFVF